MSLKVHQNFFGEHWFLIKIIFAVLIKMLMNFGLSTYVNNSQYFRYKFLSLYNKKRKYYKIWKKRHYRQNIWIFFLNQIYVGSDVFLEMYFFVHLSFFSMILPFLSPFSFNFNLNFFSLRIALIFYCLLIYLFYIYFLCVILIASQKNRTAVLFISNLFSV